MNARATAAWLEGLYDRIVSSSPAHVREDAYAAALGYPRCGQQVTLPTPTGTRTYTCVRDHADTTPLEHTAADGTLWYRDWSTVPAPWVIHPRGAPTLTLTARSTKEAA